MLYILCLVLDGLFVAIVYYASVGWQCLIVVFGLRTLGCGWLIWVCVLVYLVVLDWCG